MARKKTANDKVKFGEYTTERVDFNDKERQEINDYLDGRTVDFLSGLLDCLDSGWTVRFVYRESDALYQCSVTQSLRAHTYGGMVFILVHPDLDKLAQVFYYFYCELLATEKHRSRARLVTDNW